MTPATQEMIQAYTEQRKEFAARAFSIGTDLSEPQKWKAVQHLLWEPCWCGKDGFPQQVYGPALPHKFNLLDFAADPDAEPAIEQRGAWKALRVTVSRVLSLCDYASGDAWFDALSQKNRKKLRWLRNAVPKLGAEIRPIRSAETFDDFETLYHAQFQGEPDIMRKGVRTILLSLPESQFCGRVLYSPDGKPLAGALGFFLGSGFFFTHLTRGEGNPEYDKYSPGFWLTYSLIRELFEQHPETKYFFMGPGDYDYKHAFLGKILPVYRCERDSFWNLPGLIRMRHRLRKERALWKAAQS